VAADARGGRVVWALREIRALVDLHFNLYKCRNYPRLRRNKITLYILEVLFESLLQSCSQHMQIKYYQRLTFDVHPMIKQSTRYIRFLTG
jgi:hypothetical protein